MAIFTFCAHIITRTICTHQLGGALAQVAGDAVRQHIGPVSWQLNHVRIPNLHAHWRSNTMQSGDKILGLLSISLGEHHQVVQEFGRGNHPLPTKLLGPVSVVGRVGILGGKQGSDMSHGTHT